jgi:hypothetical protein
VYLADRKQDSGVMLAMPTMNERSTYPLPIHTAISTLVLKNQREVELELYQRLIGIRNGWRMERQVVRQFQENIYQAKKNLYLHVSTTTCFLENRQLVPIQWNVIIRGSSASARFSLLPLEC